MESVISQMGMRVVIPVLQPDGQFGQMEHVPASTCSALQAENEKMREQLKEARLLLQMSGEMVPKREKSCKPGPNSCIVCRWRDEYHERLTTFLSHFTQEQP